MGRTKLTEVAIRGSSYVVTATFSDAPTTMTWTLSDDAGTVINGREDETIATPSTSETVMLSGDDLEFLSGEDPAAETIWRVLTLEGTYMSSYSGVLEPIRDEVWFRLQDTVVDTE